MVLCVMLGGIDNLGFRRSFFAQPSAKVGRTGQSSVDQLKETYQRMHKIPFPKTKANPARIRFIGDFIRVVLKCMVHDLTVPL